MSSPSIDPICRGVRRTLTTEGREALRDDPAAQQHLADCPDCQAFLEAQAELEALLFELPVMDAPDELVQRVLLAVEREGAANPGSAAGNAIVASPWWRKLFLSVRAWAPALAGYRPALALGATIAIAAVVGLSLLQTRNHVPEPASMEDSEALPSPTPELREEARGKFRSRGYVGGSDASGRGAPSDGSLPEAPLQADAPEEIQVLEKSLGSVFSSYLPAPDSERRGSREADGSRQEVAKPHSAEPMSVEPEVEGQDGASRRAGLFSAPVIEELRPVGGELDDLVTAEYIPKDARRRNDQDLDGGPRIQEEPKEEQPAKKDLDTGFGDQAGSADLLSEDLISQEAHDFLAERDRVEGLDFLDADGYWANTYVPGDAVFRLLQARLAGAPLKVHEGARQTPQPFDPPANAALAVYLQADRAGVDGETRTLLQVGLQSTERRSGRRPALNLALVLDLTGDLTGDLATEDAAALRSLVMALGDHRDVEDRFHLVVAGRPGAVLVEPEGFRHGRLLVTLDQLFGVGGGLAATLSLEEALATAVETLSREDDPNAPLGSSVVLLATPRTLGGETAAIAALAHRSAVEGVLVSAIGVGDGVDRAELDRVVLAGQGSRRLMTTGGEAADLVERELASASRAVARAVRVRIRLAPGVKLVDVVGSRRLDALQAEEVREAEQGVDLQLARRMSIEADRGEDEEGIQIVIPSFYSGDAHVILLDVVVPGPGPIADVTLRYKDLVYLRNGVSRDQLSLPRGREAAGPLQLNVLENLLAYRLFETLEGAGGLVAAGQAEAARQRLAAFAGLLRGLRAEIPGLAQDRDLAGDLALLEGYQALLDPATGASAPDLRTLVDSLRLAARLKILPQPAGGDE
jgi:hypothetical protein